MELAEKIIQLTKSKSKFIFLPLPEDDPKLRNPDTQIAQKVLGWQALTSLDEGLEKTIKYFQN